MADCLTEDLWLDVLMNPGWKNRSLPNRAALLIVYNKLTRSFKLAARRFLGKNVVYRETRHALIYTVYKLLKGLPLVKVGFSIYHLQ